MKKIVVVVRVAAGLANREVTFEGENLEVIDRSASTTDYNKLVITENSEKKHTVAVFREWVYWHEEKVDGDEIFGHYNADGIMIPMSKRFIDEHSDILKSMNFFDLVRYNPDKDKPE